MAYTLPDDVDARPIAIVGAGTLGRRIAAMYAAGGSARSGSSTRRRTSGRPRGTS